MKNIVILIIFAVLTGLLIRFDGQRKENVKIEFEKLRPVKEKINVYYNGFKIGTSKKFLPCPHSKGVCIDIDLKNNAMFIPSNIKAKMKQKRIHEKRYEDYIELIYPDKPAFTPLSSGMVIKGELSAGFHNYINEEVNYNDMEKMKISLIKTTENLEKSTGLLVDILYSLNEITQKSQNNIEETSKNINKTAENLNKITEKINSAVDYKTVKNIMQNVNLTSDNLNQASYNFKEFTGNINNGTLNIKETMEAIDDTIKNTDEITRGINRTLKKPFGGFALIFGRAIK